MATFSELVETLEARLFTGRDAQLALFNEWLNTPAGRAADLAIPRVLEVTGPGGMGKTSLLHAFGREAQRRGRRVIALDAAGWQSPEDALRALAPAREAGTSDQTPPVVLFDTFEALAEHSGLAAYVLGQLLPALDAGIKLVIAGRHSIALHWSKVEQRGEQHSAPPAAGALAHGAWRSLVRTLALGAFTPEEGEQYLEKRGVAAALLPRVLAAAGGHPLALSLAADLAQQYGTTGLRDLAAAPEWHMVVRSLVERLLRDTPDRSLRALLEAGAMVRQFDVGALEAIAGEPGAGEAFERLCRLSVIRPADHGLSLHPEARRLLADDLRWRNPDRYRQLRLRALAYYRQRMAKAPPEDRAWLLTERLYLWEHALLQALMFEADEAGQVWLDPGAAGDLPDLLSIWDEFQRVVTQREGAQEDEAAVREFIGRLVRFPSARVRVARDLEGKAVGFSIVMPVCDESIELFPVKHGLAKLIHALWGQDGVVHLPPTVQESSIYYLTHLASRQANAPAVRAALLRDLCGLFALGGTYLCATAVPEYQRLLEASGFARVPEGRAYLWGDDQPVEGYVLDLAQIGVDAWIESLVSGTRLPQPAPAGSSETLEQTVRDALLHWQDDAWLAQSPLAQRMAGQVAGQVAGRALADGNDATRADAVRGALRAALARAAAAVPAHRPDQALPLRAIDLGYMQPGISHERAAERLAVSRSTFYRLLKRGTEALTRHLSAPGVRERTGAGNTAEATAPHWPMSARVA